MAQQLTVLKMKANLARSRAHSDTQRARVLQWKEQGRDELSERAAGILLVMQQHVALSIDFLARMEAAEAQRASPSEVNRLEDNAQDRFLIYGETLIGHMRGHRDTIPAALALVAEYYSKGCVDVTLSDEETGRVYRWPGLSRDDPRFRNGTVILERSIRSMRTSRPQNENILAR